MQYSTAALMHGDTTYSIKITVVDELAWSTRSQTHLWFYEVYDEAPSYQWRNAVENEDPWDDYIPNVYTQARDITGDTLTLAEVEASGIFSWQKYLAENNEENEVTFTLNFGLLHTIEQDEYTGLTRDIVYGTMADQATSVRAMMEAEYQPPPEEGQTPEPVDNSPEFISFDYYPFRYVDIDYAATTTMCDDDWLFLIEHFEEGIDSTVISALEYDVPVYFYPQTFGAAGGPVMYNDSSGNLDYNSYQYRKPASQEFRMLCNLALLHQAKGIFPYNLCSYLEFDSNGDPNIIMSSLLDRHNITFDAPYEEWVYTGRWPDDSLAYIRPNSIPPWIDGFDPLYELPPAPPIQIPGVPKDDEIWYTWFFKPYGNLYNSLENTLGQIAWIAPEMYNLWWYEHGGIPYWDAATISCPDSNYCEHYVAPEIKILEREDNNTIYLYYVNRYCRSEELPVHVSLYGVDIPQGDLLSETALDHSRRFLIPVDLSLPHGHYSFDDTLAAGEARLIEFVDIFPATLADLRITSPDIFRRPVGSLDKETDLRCTAGTGVELGATFYNMGTSSAGPVTVAFRDVTDPDIPHILGTDRISFSGLSQDYWPDSSTALITWNTDSGDIGAHIIEISASSLSGEPDPDDNSVKVTFLVEPRDYATEVRNDPWDMSEGGSNPWHTDDIDSVALYWDNTAWTDSVSGMFEGALAVPSGDMYRGDISLDVPVDIDTEQYKFFSMGTVGENPYEAGNVCAVFMKWRKASGAYSGWFNLGFGPGNGWDQWTIRGPVDLDERTGGVWSEEDALELWLRFQCSKPEPPVKLVPIDLRIGWIRLEEGEI